jgi:hypothetical protein
LAAVAALAVTLTPVALSSHASSRRLLGPACPAVAAASLVLSAQGKLAPALVLVAAVVLFDASNFVMGTGQTGGVLGTLAGAASVAVLAVLVAAVLDPPFSGYRPFVMCGLVAALVPAGTALGGWISSGRRLPALRRLDSAILAGPAWLIGAHVLLHR